MQITLKPYLYYRLQIYQQKGDSSIDKNNFNAIELRINMKYIFYLLLECAMCNIILNFLLVLKNNSVVISGDVFLDRRL